MDKKTVIMLIILTILLIIGTFMTYTLIQKNNIKIIQGDIDTRLGDIRMSEGIALKYLEVYTIHDNDTYKEVKERTKEYLSGEIERGLFKSEEYELPETPRVYYKVKDIKGWEKGKDHLFKVDIELTGGKLIDITLIITVRNYKVVEIEKL